MTPNNSRPATENDLTNITDVITYILVSIIGKETKMTPIVENQFIESYKVTKKDAVSGRIYLHELLETDRLFVKIEPFDNYQIVSEEGVSLVSVFLKSNLVKKMEKVDTETGVLVEMPEKQNMDFAELKKEINRKDKTAKIKKL